MGSGALRLLGEKHHYHCSIIPQTPISRRKSITEKLDMDLAKEDLRRDDEERLEELIENLARYMCLKMIWLLINYKLKTVYYITKH